MVVWSSGLSSGVRNPFQLAGVQAPQGVGEPYGGYALGPTTALLPFIYDHADQQRGTWGYLQELFRALSSHHSGGMV